MSIFDRDDQPLWPADAPNPDVWCHRCQKIHKAHPYTQADEDRYLDIAAQRIAETIDRDIESYVIRDIAQRFGHEMLSMTLPKEPIR